jgi:hypothetical protein
MGGVKKTKDYPQSSVYSKNEKILKNGTPNRGIVCQSVPF